jgi:uncharacterized membrane protein
MPPSRRADIRRVARVVLALVMIAIGLTHFIAPAGFVKIVPSSFPSPLALVLVSGFFEIAGGVGLLIARVRRAASVGLVLLYIAVFPANVNMAVNDVQLGDVHVPSALLWLRLPFQLVLIAWAIWVGRPEPK